MQMRYHVFPANSVEETAMTQRFQLLPLPCYHQLHSLEKNFENRN